MDAVQTFAGTSLDTILERMAVLAAENTAEGLSTMLGRPIRMTVPRLELVPISEVPTLVGGAEQEAVGIYLMVSGDLPGHVMLILPIADALRLADMLMEVPEGTTKAFGIMERSALGEVGNVATCLFLNAIAEATGLGMRPSPPAVMIDMVGAIIDIILVSAGMVSDEILLLEAEFQGPDRSVEMYFWMVPTAMMATGA
ncbi:MAG: chemotaxis protein CheC [Anaerolineae bacterium]